MDLFISYRREGGSVWANLLNTKLSALKIKIFYDKYKIENEDFSTKIKKCLERSPNVLLVLSPEIFAKNKEREVDWVLEEINLAFTLKKNLILVQVDGFNLERDLAQSHEVVQKLTKLNMLKYNNDSPAIEEACIKDIVNRMVDADGRPFSLGEQINSNSWYNKYGMTDEDALWIKTDYAVCHKWDQRMLARLCNEPVLKRKKELSLFVLKAYDIETYKKKYDFINPETGKPYIANVYGRTYASDVKFANELFGEGHFVADDDDGTPLDEVQEILQKNNLRGFDIVDMTLVIKDMEQPAKVVREMSKILNPDGGVLFIRELDDDFVKAYPHEDIIKKMVELLDLDPGAGNRHTGKKIYTFLKQAGADKVYISDEVISTANHKAIYQEQMCQSYFSYLKPELRNLAKEDPDTYREAYLWIEKNYDDVENLFCSSEFYFRAGYISGYGTFEPDDDSVE